MELFVDNWFKYGYNNDCTKIKRTSSSDIFFVDFEQYSSISFRSTRIKALSLIVCILFGIGMEFYQKYFVPSRGFEVGDMLADAIGALLVLPFFNMVKHFIQPKAKSI
jgi:hypothetical protein